MSQNSYKREEENTTKYASLLKGIGIPIQELENLFNSFDRTDEYPAQNRFKTNYCIAMTRNTFIHNFIKKSSK